MENEDKKAVDEFLSGITAEQEDPFKQEEGTEKVEEETPEEEQETEESEEKLPFHKDPKVQRYVEKQIAKALEGMKPQQQQKFIEDAQNSDDPVKAFEALIGNDTPEKQAVLNSLRKSFSSLEEKATAAQRAIEEERQAEEQATRELEEGFENIEDTFNVNLTGKLKSDFIDFVRKVAPKDRDGDIVAYPDFVSTFETFQELRKKPNTVNRSLAARSMARSAEAQPSKADEPINWNTVDRIFNR